MAIAATTGEWKKTACILCTLNCGLEVLVDDHRILKIKGDKAHPGSEGYACQKPQRLDYYQNGKDRLTSPLRRRADGTHEEISWDTAIAEIAEKLKAIRDTHGGHALAYFGGGGQGNHLNGAYGTCLRSALGTPYIYTSLAQEKTGGFWVDGKLFGKQNCHPTEDATNADFLLIIGSNPWQSHGIPRARTLLQEFAKDENRTLVVVDPLRTETAQKADVFLQVKPGGDAHMMLAMLGTIVQEGLEDTAFIEKHTEGYETVRTMLEKIPVDDYALEAGLDPEMVKQVARDYAQTEKACIRTDLGLEHSLHSTLNNYLVRLMYLITGHFGKEGTNTFHTFLMPLIGHSKDPEDGGMTTKVMKMREIGKLYPPNVLPQEINTDHPDRVRGLVVDSGNPVMTGADSQAYREAFKNLELSVVIDVAMTETARLAEYVLPASSQFEKAEATFFNFEFPNNYFQLRKPLFEPAPGTLPEAEIYRRLVVALGELPDRFEELELAAIEDRKNPAAMMFPMALQGAASDHPEWKPYLPLVLYATLGKALPKGMESAALLWFSAQMFAGKSGKNLERAGVKDEGAGLAEAFFQKILTSDSGLMFSSSDYDETWDTLRHKGGKIHLPIMEMLDEIEGLEPLSSESKYPFILQAGERRSYNANQIIRSKDWRKKDPDGAMKIHPEDAAELGLADGGKAEVESARGVITVHVWVTDEIRLGMVSMPHGYGMLEEQEDGTISQTGPSINDLTDSDHCDKISKTPFHKHVPVAIRSLTTA